MEHCKSHNVEMDNFPDESANPNVPPPDLDELLVKLSETQRQSYESFVKYKSVDQVSAYRALKSSTIITHLCEAIKIGLPVDFSCLNISDNVRETIENAIRSPAIDSNVLRLGPIKTECDKANPVDEVTFDAIKVIVAILIAKFGVKDNKLQWNVQSQSTVRQDDELKSFETKENGDTNHSSKSSAETSLKRSLSNVNSNQVKERSVPSWMNDSAKCKEVMAKKMKKNSLFK